MDKRILIPTDFSRNALNAIHYALHLYEKKKCEFYFLNVFRTEYYTTGTLIVPEPGSEAYETAKSVSEEGFAKLLEDLYLHHDNPMHTYHTISSNNLLSEAIRQTIKKNDIELMVMGTQGTTRTKGIIFGSNTVMAMENIRECPVLAVPENFRFSTPTEIVFPTNFKAAFKRKELNYLIEIAQMHNAGIQVLYVNKEPGLNKVQESNKQLLDEILEDVDHSFEILSDPNIPKAIASFVKSRDSDMIAFINRKHFFFESIFSRPLVKEIGYNATTPILALH
jgi:nucleotide-binding universal stress UspA family protein